MIRALRLVGLVFVLAWVVHTIALSGSAMISVDYLRLLRSSPMAVQQAQGKPYQQATIRLSRRLPKKVRVLMIIDQIDIDQEYAQYWTTYWLYPRSVRLTSSPGAAANAPEETIVYVQSRVRPAIDVPSGHLVDSVWSYPDGTVVTSYVRAGG